MYRSASTSPPPRPPSVPDDREAPPSASICCCCLCALIFLTPVMMLLLADTQLGIPDIRVESVSTVDESKWVIGFSVKNPNLISTINYYRHTDVSLQDATSNKYIGASIIPPFKQRPSNTARFNTTMIAVNAPTGFKPDPNSISMVTIRLRTAMDYTGLPFAHTLGCWNCWITPYTIFTCKDFKNLFSPTKRVSFGDPLRCL